MILRADLHIHSLYSNQTQIRRWGKYLGKYLIDSRSKIKDILITAKNKGLDIISITDHAEIEGSLKATEIANKYGLIAIPGLEIATKQGHLLTYGIGHNIPDSLEVTRTALRIRKMGGVIVAPHPFSFQGVFLRGKGKLLLKQKLLDAIEVYTPLGKLDPKALRMASEFKLAPLASSDSKALFSIGSVYTEINSDKKDATSIIRAIKKRQTKPVCDQKINRLRLILKTIKSNYLNYDGNLENSDSD